MRSLLATTALLAVTTALNAQPLPDEAALAGQLSRALPGYWQVNDLTIVASTQAGDAMRPRAYIRFEAGAAPVADLHLQAGREGPFAVLTRTVEAGASRRLYGVFDLSYAAGNWTGDPLIENPVDGLGQPRDMFTLPTLVLGDPDGEAALQALRTNTLAEAAAALERELAALRSAQAAELANLEIAHAEALAAQRSRNAAALSEADEAFKAERATLERAHREELARLTAEAAPRLAEAEAALQRALAEADSRAAEAMRARQAAQEAELAALDAQHAERRNALVARQEAELAELAGAEAQRARELAAARQALAAALREVQERVDTANPNVAA